MKPLFLHGKGICLHICLACLQTAAAEHSPGDGGPGAGAAGVGAGRAVRDVNSAFGSKPPLGMMFPAHLLSWTSRREIALLEGFCRGREGRILFLSVSELTYRMERGAGKNQPERSFFLLYLFIFSSLEKLLHETSVVPVW